MIKIKPLLPVLKERKRYVLYEVDSKDKMRNPTKFILIKLREFIGDLGLARAGVKFLTFKGNRGILQVNHKFLDEVKAGLGLIDSINNSQVRLRTLKVSGVLNKIKDRV